MYIQKDPEGVADAPTTEMQKTEALKSIRHIALDLDGTVYKGEHLFDCTVPFLETIKRMGISHTFLTNNSSRNATDYVTHLGEMGIHAKKDDVFTSGDATIEYLRQELPEGKRLFLLGTPSLCTQFIDAGYFLCGDTPDDVPDAIVIGLDSALSYERLCRAAFWIEQGLPYVATHPDRVCPTQQRTVLVDCGSICAALEQATGRLPQAVLGKPNRLMLQGILQRYRLEPKQLLMVGDRLYTDMAMAHASGTLGVLVLTGEATASQAIESKTPPDLVVQDLGELGNLLQKTWRIDGAQRSTLRHPTQQEPLSIEGGTIDRTGRGMV